MIRQTDKRYAVGIDIGGTKCAVVLGKGEIPDSYEDDFIIECRCFQTKSHNTWQETINHIINVTETLLADRGIEPANLIGIGISCGGPLDYQNGVILSPPNLVGWNQVPIVELLKNHFKVPVYLQNDANACALAEWKFGAARGKRNVIFLTFGTGLGAGLILDGRLYHGANDMAGEVGHIRMSDNGPVGYGKSGSLEGFCSGGGLLQLGRMKILERLQLGEHPKLFEEAGGLEHLTAKHIGLAAQAGDPLACEILETSAHYLGRGLALLIDVLNPEMIVIGSIFQRCEAFIRPEMEAVIRREALGRSAQQCQIVPAMLKNAIGNYAALSVAFGL